MKSHILAMNGNVPSEFDSNSSPIFINWLIIGFLFIVHFFFRPILTPLFLLLIIPYIQHWRQQRRLVPSTAFNIAIGALLVALALSTVSTPQLTNSLPKIVGVLLGVTAFFCTVLTGKHLQNNKNNLILGLGVWGWFFAFGGGLLMVAQARLPILGRVVNQVINPNEIAGIITLILPFFVGLMLTKNQSIWVRAGTTIATISLLIGVIATGSRSAILAIGIGLFTFAVIKLTKHWGQATFVFGVVAVLAAGILIFLNSRSGGELFNLDGRLPIWQRAVYAIGDFPLTGTGMNNFRLLLRNLYLMPELPPFFDYAHAHNHWLQVGLDLGILGLIGFSALWVGVVQLYFEQSKKVDGHWDSAELGVFIALFAFAIFGLTDTIALGAKPSILFWMALGLSVPILKKQTHTVPAQAG